MIKKGFSKKFDIYDEEDCEEQDILGHGLKKLMPSCSHGVVPFLTINKSIIHIGKLDHIQYQTDWNLVIDCAGGYYSHGTMVIPSYLQILKKHIIPTLSIPWSDFSLPPVRPEFWSELVSNLPKGKIALGCVGGHGRTGTATAALLIASKKMSAKEAIEFVRENYCNMAIETLQQEEYLIVLEEQLTK